VIGLRNLPWYAQCLLAAALAGLTIGLAAGLWPGGGEQLVSAVNWDSRPAAPVVPVELLLEKLQTSKQWDRGAVEPAETETPVEEEGEPELIRPGVFKYLHLVAILQDPLQPDAAQDAPRVAVMRVKNLPENMAPLLLIEADSGGLLQWRSGDMVAPEWHVSAITGSALLLKAEDGAEQLEYKLFEW
jgi:hypothetical protein